MRKCEHLKEEARMRRRRKRRGGRCQGGGGGGREGDNTEGIVNREGKQEVSIRSIGL